MFRNSRAAMMVGRKTMIMGSTPFRGIKLHEYQAGALLDSFKVSIPLGEVAFTPKEAFDIASKLPGGCVVKSQILGGGRGMGHFKETGFKGGVHLVKTADEAKAIAEKMIGYSLVTKQSGEDGLPVNCVYIVQKLSIEKEMYLSITLDRAAGCPVFVFSPAGGMSIEDVAHETPEKIFKIHVNPFTGPKKEEFLKAATDLGIPAQKEKLADLM